MLEAEPGVVISEPAHEREVVRVGAGIVVVCAAILFVSLMVPWYSHAAFCDVGACPAVLSSGWTSLGASSALIVAAALAGVLPAIGLGLRRPAPTLWLIGAAAGLGAGLLVLFRIAVAPAAIGVLAAHRTAGPFIALLGALGIAGGSTLAGLGERFFEPARNAMAVLATLAVSCLAVIVSLFLPWAREARAFPALIGGLSTIQTGWQRSSTMAVLLLLGALAVMSAAVLVSVIRWRSSFFALAGGGWLLAAIAVVVTPLVSGSRLPGRAIVRLAAYEPGYYVCLGAAALIVLSGLYAAVAGGAAAERSEPKS